MSNETKIAEIKELGKNAQGRRELMKHLEGGRLTQGQAIKAFCFDCLGYYGDGVMDCGNDGCPLHPFMPYNPKRAKAHTSNPAGPPKKQRGHKKA